MTETGIGGLTREETELPAVSVVIPTFNSESTLASCLKSIQCQTYPNIEVLVVDKYSADRTLGIAQKYGAKTLLFNGERSAARNIGAEEGDGLFLFFVDSDMELTPKVVEECVSVCSSKGNDAVMIPEESVARGFLSECRKIEKQLRLREEIFGNPRFLKRETFQKLGGYDEGLIYGEDSDLHLRLEKARANICRIQAKILHHEDELSLKQIVLKAYLYGTGLPSLLKKNPSILVRKHFFALRTTYLRNIHTLLRNPLHLVGLIFMKTVECEAYLAGLLTRFFLIH